MLGLKFEGLWTKKTLVGLGLGQFLSLLITSTGFSSSELARKGINAPTSQTFLNYVLLAIFYGSIMLYRRQPLKAKWYYYILLALVDVEANFLVVKAYQYTSLTSVMLLDCWTIPSVMLLTWIFLQTKYRFKKITGVVVCVAGLVLVVFSDVHSGDRSAGSNPRKGDALVIAGSTLYAICNVSEALSPMKSTGSSFHLLFSQSCKCAPVDIGVADGLMPFNSPGGSFPIKSQDCSFGASSLFTCHS